MHGVPGEPEGILPRNTSEGICPADPDYSRRGIVVVIVAESGLMDVERGAAGGTFADATLRLLKHTGGIDFDKNGGSAVIGVDHEGSAVGDVDNRRGHDTGARA